MSDHNEDLKNAYISAIDSQGRDAANLIVTANGGAAGNQGWRTIPPAKVAAAIAALEALATGHKSDESAIARGLDLIRKQVFGKSKAATPPRELDATAIYDRWNHPPVAE